MVPPPRNIEVKWKRMTNEKWKMTNGKWTVSYCVTLHPSPRPQKLHER
ncbi:MAG: hypothetical protein QOD75_2850 [Blastocatellia bacterium]|jgi:hypothetical protein|nr:hypothetical protein [Blastocatellia bacterium]